MRAVPPRLGASPPALSRGPQVAGLQPNHSYSHHAIAGYSTDGSTSVSAMVQTFDEPDLECKDMLHIVERGPSEKTVLLTS